MAYYSGQKDSFDTDTGIWTDVSAVGTVTIANSKKTFDKTSGDTTWDNFGTYMTNTRVFAKGDIWFFAFQLDDVNTSGANGTYTQLGLKQGAGLNTAGLVVTNYCYPDGGSVKSHGQSSGVMTDQNPSEALASATTYICKCTCDGTNGKLSFSIIGGNYASYTALGNPLVDATPSGGAYALRFQANLYAIHSDVSLLYYGWCDSGGPTPDAPSGLGATAVSDTEIDLDWTNNEYADFETGFSIERSTTSGSGFSEIDTVAFGNVTYADTTALPNVTYYYRIRSYFTFNGTDYYSAYTAEASATIVVATGDSGADLLALGEL